ncbi:MAG: hypothetical protein IPK00_14585 [Deltaproteobacteria bacterium]|nr:hypothetical protein [Deltaproteobacteria bacterium]
MSAPRIGCIAWGSLLWDPRTLPLAAPFVHDGPMLPIEFSRVALDGRVTLVIDPEAAPVRTFWAPLTVDSLAAGIAELARREGITAERVADWIGVVGRPGFDCAAVASERVAPATRAAIAGWLAERPLDAVLWTALPSRGSDGRFARPDCDELIAQLESLSASARERAEQYIRRAPAMLRTPNRLRFEAVFGWTAQDGSEGDRRGEH